MEKQKYLPIITARGGSKGLPGKNILSLKSKPLIAYTIESFLNSGLPGDCYVSTDNEEISKVANQYGAKVIERPSELSTDTASSASAIIHAVEELKKKNLAFTDFILLQPTSPLRNGHDIAKSVRLYEEKGGVGSVVSMTLVDTHPYKCFKKDNNGNAVPLFGEEYLAMPRQNLPNVLQQNGAIYITAIDDFLKNEVFCASPVTPYIMDAEKSIDIDTKLDLQIAEALLSQ